MALPYLCGRRSEIPKLVERNIRKQTVKHNTFTSSISASSSFGSMFATALLLLLFAAFTEAEFAATLSFSYVDMFLLLMVKCFFGDIVNDDEAFK
jgi:hypothetical protein